MKETFGITVLPPSPLKSAGDGLQESLHHYALRMAEMCCLPLGRFEMFLLRDDASASKAGNAFFPSSWIGPRSNFRPLLAALKRDTGLENLHTGTFHVVADVMGRGGTRRRQVRGEGRAWCPACYFKWDENSSCEPLIWAFDMLTACPTHSVLLETRCDACNAPQGFSVAYRKRRRCEHCNNALGHDHGVQELAWQNQWVNKTLLQFTQWLEETDEPINLLNYEVFLHQLNERQKAEGTVRPAVLRYLSTNRDVASRKLCLPTISTLLNFAAFQGTTIQAILCEPSFAASRNLIDEGGRFEGLLFKRRDLSDAQARVIFILSRLVASGLAIPPPSIVWLELKLWLDKVRDICPFEQGQYIDKFRAQPTRLSLQRFLNGVNYCLRQLEQDDSEPDKSKVVKLHESLGYERKDASQCVEAALNLRDALLLSLDKTQLAQFEADRTRVLADWTANANIEAK